MTERKTVPSDIKIQNRQMVYNYIRRKGAASKQDVVVDLQLSLPTVTQNLKYLQKKGLVDISHQIENTGGRNAAAYAYMKEAKAGIGVYVTAHHINVVAVDMSGNVICKGRERIKFNLNDENYLKRIAFNVEQVRKDAHLTAEQIIGVGIAVPGLVSRNNDRVIYGVSLGFTGVTSKKIEEFIPYPVELYHDSYVAGYAEVWREQGIKNAFYLNLNHSVGGAIVIDREIYNGDNNNGGDICHMTMIDQGGERCYCGKYGCMDTLCNAGFLDRHTDGNLDDFFTLLEQGDAQIAKVWDTYLNQLSLVVNNIRMLFDSVIIIGGYVGEYLEDYMDELRKRVDRRNTFGDRAKTYLITSQYKGDATAVGSGILMIEAFMEQI